MRPASPRKVSIAGVVISHETFGDSLRYRVSQACFENMGHDDALRNRLFDSIECDVNGVFDLMRDNFVELATWSGNGRGCSNRLADLAIFMESIGGWVAGRSLCAPVIQYCGAGKWSQAGRATFRTTPQAELPRVGATERSRTKAENKHALMT